MGLAPTRSQESFAKTHVGQGTDVFGFGYRLGNILTIGGTSLVFVFSLPVE